MGGKPIKVDVLVIGAGLVGQTAALAMQAYGLDVMLVDRGPAPKRFSPKAHQDWDQRIYAISPENIAWLKRLDVWAALDQDRVTPIQGMEIWGDANQAPLSLSAQSVPVENLGVILESSALLDACYQRIKALEVKTLFNRQCVSINSDANQTSVIVQAKTNQQQIDADLVVAADGANSWVRQQLNFAHLKKPYSQSAIVANFLVEKSHDGIARQWFNQANEEALDVLAWLPMPDQTISIVWSLPTDKANAFMAMEGVALTERVQSVGQSLLGNMKMVTPPACFPLNLSGVVNPVLGSTVLLGDAAHRIHPLAGQGVNLGFRDVADLEAILQSKGRYQAINDPQLLKKYSRQRKIDVLKMVGLTDGLYQLFSAKQSWINHVRQWGLNSTNRYDLVKRMLVQQAVQP